MSNTISRAKWFCDTCAPTKRGGATACSDCCGFQPAPEVEYHVGRSFTGHDIEDSCDCPKAGCGLALMGHPFKDVWCDQHGLEATRTMRQIHAATDCPGRAA